MKVIDKINNKLLPVMAFALFMGLNNTLVAQEVSQDAGTYALVDDANRKKVEGVITDAVTKKPVVGASVSSGNVSTLTDDNGRYSLSVASGNATISVAAPGYSLREVAIRSRDNIDISMVNEHFTSAYGLIPSETGEKSVTTSTQAANTVDEFPNITPGSTIEEMIQTRLGHVRSITRSGTPLMGSALFIRGLNSLNANAQPLFIIDGVIWDNMLGATSSHEGFFINPLADIDLKDLESITVIKDGSAIYGSKASNGVILVNTIRGRHIATRITLNTSVGYSFSPSSIPVLNSSDYRILASEMYSGAGYSPLEISNMPFFNENPSYIYYNKYHNNTDWNDQIMRNAFSQSHAVNVTGGDDKALYAFSMGYTNIDNVIKNSGMDRMNARFNSDIHLSRKLDVSTDIAFTNINRDVFDDGMQERTSPYYMSLIKSPALSPYSFALDGSRTKNLESYDDLGNQGLGIGNPVYFIDYAQQTNNQYRFNVNIKPEFKFDERFSLSTLFAYSLDKVKESYFIPNDGTTPVYIKNYGYSYNTAKSLVARQVQLYSDTQFKFKNRFQNEHAVNLLAGVRYVSQDYEMDYVEGHNTDGNDIINISSNLKYLKTYGINDKNRTLSWYASGDYGFRDKYFLNVSASLDGSSKFGKNAGIGMFDHGWAFFPAVSGAWLASSEDFMAGVEWLDLLKIRASYALTGNDDIDSYAKSAYFQSVNFLGKGVGLELTNLQNDDIKWETTSKFNAGINLGLFNERLTLTADIFSSRTKDLLTLITLPNVSAIETYWGNAGELSNRGFEVSANINLINTRDFKWEMNLNASHYKNKIEKLPQGDFITELYGAEIQTKVGQAAGVFYGYKSLGVISSQEEAEALNDGNGLKIRNSNGTYSYFGAGDILFEDRNKDGVIDEKDKMVIGNPNPDLVGLIGNRFKIKHVTLDVLFSFSYGNDVYNGVRRNLESMDGFYNQSKATLNRWRVDGDITSIPRLSYDDPMGNARFSSRWIEDGSYLRLKTVSLSYKVPFDIPFIEGLTVWGAANNLWHYSKYLGTDPETSVSNSVLYQGIDAGLTPQYSSYYVGVKINL